MGHHARVLDTPGQANLRGAGAVAPGRLQSQQTCVSTGTVVPGPANLWWCIQGIVTFSGQAKIMFWIPGQRLNDNQSSVLLSYHCHHWTLQLLHFNIDTRLIGKSILAAWWRPRGWHRDRNRMGKGRQSSLLWQLGPLV